MKKIFFIILGSILLLIAGNIVFISHSNNLRSNTVALKQKYYLNQKKWIGLGLTQNKKSGIKVITVISDSPAMKAGLKNGDIIKKVNGNDVKKIKDLQNILNPIPVNHGVILGISRDRASMDLYVRVQSINSTNLK